MRILLLTLGTRGDIQPFLALGQGLKRNGHEVIVCTSSGFEPWIRELGLDYSYMNNEILDLVNSEAGRKSMEGAGGIWGYPKQILEQSRRFKSIFRKTLLDEWEAAQGAQAIVYHPGAAGGYHIAEALGIRSVMADPLPTWIPTKEFPHIVTPDLGLGGWYNRLTHLLIRVVPRLLFGSVVNRWRKKTLNLPSRSLFANDLIQANGQPVPALLAFSRHVLPPPPDWPESVRVTGYWFLDENKSWHAPDSLVEFLKAGTPPVFIGFGSMAGRDPSRKARLVLDALMQSGQRGIIVTGWGGLQISVPPQNVYVAEFIPYDWLLPHVAAVVHHGGAGTTAAGLRAGKPMLICPFVADQPFWGNRVAALGAGPPPIPQRKLTADQLAKAIQQIVADKQMRQRAVELGEKIRAEDGVGNAVEFIEGIFIR